MDKDEKHIIHQLSKSSAELPADDYFASLKNSLLAALPAEEPKIVPLYKKWWFVSSAAASVVLIVVLSLFMKQEKQEIASPDWNTVSSDEMFAYIENNIGDFETDELAAHLDEIPSLSVAESVTYKQQAQKKETNVTKLLDELDKEEILEYLREDVGEMDDETITGY